MANIDIYLRGVPSDADPDDVRLYDPTQPDAATDYIPPGPNVNLMGAMALAWTMAWGPQSAAPIAAAIAPAPVVVDQPTPLPFPQTVLAQWQVDWPAQGWRRVAPLTLVYGDQPPRRVLPSVVGQWQQAWAAQGPAPNAAWNAAAIIPTFIPASGIPWQVLAQWDPPWRMPASGSHIAPIAGIVYENLPFKRHRGRR